MKKTLPFQPLLMAIIALLCVQISTAQETVDTAFAKKDSTIVMGNVTVRGQKQFIEQTAGKLTLNVAASPVAAGGNAWEVLLKAPGMVEQQDRLQYKGKSVNVRIDGRPSNLTGEELKTMLNALPAGSIEKIEIISSASAAYDAAGGTVINIRMAKSKNLGTNGTTTMGLTAGKYARYTTGVTLNHRTKKLNVYGAYDVTGGQHYAKSISNRPVMDQSVIREDGYTKHTRQNHLFRAGVDYDFSKITSGGILIKGMFNSRKRISGTSTFVDGLSMDDSSSTVSNAGKTRINNPSVNVFLKTLPRKGHELTFNADYFSYNKRWRDDFATTYLDDKGLEYRPDYLLGNQSLAKITVSSFSADYTLTNKTGRWDIGVKSAFTKTDNNTVWTYFDENDWKDDAGKTNHFIFQENIHAGYVKYAMTIGKFSLEGGVRAEYTATVGNSLTMAQKNKKDYLDLFPSANISFGASEIHQFGFSYRRSIARFGFDVVNPFMTYISQYRYSQGNPHVKPNYSDNFEISHSYKNKVFSSIGYGHFINVLAPVFKKDPAGTAVISTTENLSSANQVEASVSYMEMLFGGKWVMTNSTGLLHAVIHDRSGAGSGSKTTGAFVGMSNQFRLNKGWTAELSANYISALTIGVMNLRPQGSVNIGVSKSILKNNGKLTLNINDLFNTQVQRFRVSSFGISSTNTEKTESRVARLVFTWKFGNKQVKAAKQRSTGIEDQKRRTESN